MNVPMHRGECTNSSNHVQNRIKSRKLE